MVNLSSNFPLANLDICEAYLFGSAVKGDCNDIDILVVSEDFDGVSRFKRAEKVKSNFPFQNIDVVCLTRKEFDRLMMQKSLFLTEILKSSILIYERPGY